MSTVTAQMTEEMYLRSFDFEPDAEFVHGHIEERPMGQYDHADWQQALTQWFVQHAKQWNIRCVPELRLRVAPGVYRIPDVSVLDRGRELEQVATFPPLAVFEVLSPEDTVKKMIRKMGEYRVMGIGQIWMVDPETAEFHQFTGTGLIITSRFQIPARGIDFDLCAIADLLQH